MMKVKAPKVMKGRPNLQKHLQAEYQLLSALAAEHSPVAFNQLQKKASVSSRTLAKYIRDSPTIVQKLERKYSITEAGIERVRNIKRDLETWTEKEGDGSQYDVDPVEVFFIGPKNFCKGTLKVTSPRKLLPGEREKMDRAISDAIRTFRSLIPEGSKNWRLSIYSHTSSKL
jgi:DNA-binding PadR family transcriptional regulator